MNQLKNNVITGLIVLLSIQLQAQERPNVLLIYADDQGWGDLHCYGAQDLHTPHLDSLAHSGVRFTQFYATSPICSPSRASLLTGRYPQRAGLSGNASSYHGDDGMPSEQYTLGELFKDAGYRTAHIGKWHMGYSPATMPNGQGFDYSFGFMGGCIDNYSHFFYWDGPNRHDLWLNGESIDRSGNYFPDLMVEEAAAFLEGNKDNPFFMYWAINIPHYPLQGEEKWLNFYKDHPSPRDKYAASVSTMDEKIGLLLHKLRELGLAENTIVIYQADQGYSEEERTFGGGGSAGIYRGAKFSLFEGGLRVPAIISWPGHIPVDEVRDQVAANIDWFPTLASYCHIKLPERKIDGKSLVPIIASPTAETAHPRLFWQSQGSKDNPQWSVLDGDWKLLHSPYGAKESELNREDYVLVNLKDNPSEQHNLADQRPDIVKKLVNAYSAWINEVYRQ